MADQLALAPRADPWRDMRALVIDAILVRVIDAGRNVQFFIRIERTPANLERGADQHDGMTIWLSPSGSPALEKDARDAIEAAANDAWSIEEAA